MKNSFKQALLLSTVICCSLSVYADESHSEKMIQDNAGMDIPRSALGNSSFPLLLIGSRDNSYGEARTHPGAMIMTLLDNKSELKRVKRYKKHKSFYFAQTAGNSVFGLTRDKLTAYNFTTSRQKLEEVTSVEAANSPTSVAATNDGELVLTAHFYEDQLTARSYDGMNFGAPQVITGCHAPNQFSIHPTEKWAYASCLRGQEIAMFAIDADKNVTEIEAPRPATGDKTGPRNFAFHPNGKVLYVVTGGSSEVLVYGINQRTGALSANPKQRVFLSTDADMSSPQRGADVKITPDGKILVAFNRLLQEMTKFAVDDDGMLTSVGNTYIGRGETRHFAMSPDGKQVAIATQDGNVSLWSVNGDGIGAPLKFKDEVTFPDAFNFIEFVR